LQLEKTEHDYPNSRIAAVRTLQRHGLSIKKWPHELLRLTLKKSDFCACQRWKKL
jgi:hypothetical protein